MAKNSIEKLYVKAKENSLSGRYICNKHIKPLTDNLPQDFDVVVLGYSVLEKPIYSIRIGNGSKKILLWSQMHGNESTTTRAIFDLFNAFKQKQDSIKAILEECTLVFIPILNPDGAEVYTRENANSVDLNRDAKELSQPESKLLRALFDDFQPDFCYNLHGQRTIFSAGNACNPATVSFLAPAQDKDLTLTENRKIAMEIISVVNKHLQTIIPNQVGIYDDAYNGNCVGDTFQGFGVPTILFEAGHYKNDYPRDVTRNLIFHSLYVSLNYISNNTIYGSNFNSYLAIPKNQKLFYDIIIRNALVANENKDIAIQYQEVLVNGKIVFSPKIEMIEDLSNYFAHKEIDANEHQVFTHDSKPIFVGYENDFVTIKNENISLNLI